MGTVWCATLFMLHACCKPRAARACNARLGRAARVGHQAVTTTRAAVAAARTSPHTPTLPPRRWCPPPRMRPAPASGRMLHARGDAQPSRLPAHSRAQRRQSASVSDEGLPADVPSEAGGGWRRDPSEYRSPITRLAMQPWRAPSSLVGSVRGVVGVAPTTPAQHAPTARRRT